MHERRFHREIERLRDPERVERLEVDRVVRLALEGLDEVHTVLDIGTGSGLFAEQFAAEGLQVTGIDANAEMLPVANRYVPDGTFYEGIAEDLPFVTGSFDLVFMGLLLHETDDLLKALQEAYRVATWRLAVLEWPPEEQEFGPPLEERLPPETVKSLARQAGFTKITETRLENLMLYRCER